MASTFTGMSRKWPHDPGLSITSSVGGAAPERTLMRRVFHSGTTRSAEPGESSPERW